MAASVPAESLPKAPDLACGYTREQDRRHKAILPSDSDLNPVLSGHGAELRTGEAVEHIIRRVIAIVQTAAMDQLVQGNNFHHPGSRRSYPSGRTDHRLVGKEHKGRLGRAIRPTEP